MLPNLVNNKEIGKLKLETFSSKAIFVAFIIYKLQKEKNKIFKVKGLQKAAEILNQNKFKLYLIRRQFCLTRDMENCLDPYHNPQN